MLLAHPTGFAEIWVGRHRHGRRRAITGASELRTDVVARTETAKEYTAGHRLYGLVEGDLLWAFDMAAVGQPLQPHLSARLKRVGDRRGHAPSGDCSTLRRGRGYRITPQRQLVLEAVDDLRPRHPRGDPRRGAAHRRRA